MSEHVLYLIPEDPEYLPEAGVVDRALALFEGFVPVAEEVSADVSEAIRFIDQGQNFERVLCPNCGERVDDWWRQQMQRAWLTRFKELAVTTNCCNRTISLNNLTYEWPAGFARFTLKARNPSIKKWLEPDQVAELEQILGCRVRQIRAYY